MPWLFHPTFLPTSENFFFFFPGLLPAVYCLLLLSNRSLPHRNLSLLEAILSLKRAILSLLEANLSLPKGYLLSPELALIW